MAMKLFKGKKKAHQRQQPLTGEELRTYQIKIYVYHTPKQKFWHGYGGINNAGI